MSAAELPRYIKSYLDDARIRQLSPSTIHERQIYLSKLPWFLQHRSHQTCDSPALRDFFAYLTQAHEEPQGRWQDGRFFSPLRPVTIRSYYTQYKVFFNWLLEEEIVETSPMSRLRPPKSGSDQIRPFTDEQLVALEKAVAASEHPHRALAILLLLL